MDRLNLNKFDIQLSKTNVLRAIGCLEGSEAYDTASRYYDELLGTVLDAFSPHITACREGGVLYCLLTVGDEISMLTERLFSEGEAMKGLIADAMADECLFEADAFLSLEIKKYCAENSVGIRARREAPKDFPLSEQAVILDKTGSGRVSLTDGFMLKPLKSMAYTLELTNDKAAFNAQHDCSRCTAENCPRRVREYTARFEILSDYNFTPQNSGPCRAVCIDIGTTTVAFEFIKDGKAVSSYKTLNPQRRFGHDVLSRIEAANRGRLGELSSALRYTLKTGFDTVCRDCGTPDTVVIAGNTVMVHLLMNYSCAELGIYPFKSNHLDTIQTTLGEIISAGTPDIPTMICGAISSFVGGDITSGLYMCDFDKSDRVNLFIDLGTNGEMAIGNKDKIIATSAAAGPAFEGGLISCGIGSVDGAVRAVSLDPVRIETIGSAPPAGVCGTGIIELMSEMKDKKIIDETGLLCAEYFEKGFPLTDSITFTQKDIRQVQMAKAAVRAGIDCLMRAYGASYEDIDTVYLAGGFGHRLALEKACNIGILPSELLSKMKPVGNSSLGGCVKMCMSGEDTNRIVHIQNISSDFPLGENRYFQELYIKHMNF